MGERRLLIAVADRRLASTGGRSNRDGYAAQGDGLRRGMTGLSPVSKAHQTSRRSKRFTSLSLNILIFSLSADFGTCDT